MLVLAGCSTNPRGMSAASPAQQTTEPVKNRVVQAHQKTKAHTLKLAKSPRTYSTQLTKSPKAKPISTLDKVTWNAHKQQGKMYRWGGSSPITGFDCSGLTQYSFKQGAGVSLPRTAAAQYQAAVKVPQQDARKGDLVFFATRGRRVSHVGIYLGDDKFIHAPRTGKSITTSKLQGYWKQRLVGFGRVPGACRPIYS
ncbi:C40 family peptidase [Candidatus Thiothrix anitrata]|nr:C40 family peptidase [Candidatus Thiothrix anitrata]